MQWCLPTNSLYNLGGWNINISNFKSAWVTWWQFGHHSSIFDSTPQYLKRLKHWAGEVAQCKGLGFTPQYHIQEKSSRGEKMLIIEVKFTTFIFLISPFFPTEINIMTSLNYFVSWFFNNLLVKKYMFQRRPKKCLVVFRLHKC